MLQKKPFISIIQYYRTLSETMLQIHPQQRHVRYTYTIVLAHHRIPSRNETSSSFLPLEKQKKDLKTQSSFSIFNDLQKRLCLKKKLKSRALTSASPLTMFISVESSRLLLVQISGNRFLLSVSPGKRRHDNRLYPRVYNTSLLLLLPIPRCLIDPCPRTILLRDSFRWQIDRARWIPSC